VVSFLRPVHLALDELIDERRNLGVATRALQRAQFERSAAVCDPASF
jgi:hypothetical protein